MSSNIYLTSSEGHSGKSAVALGFIEALSRRVGRVGVFRPLIQGGDERDAVLQLLLDREDPGTGLGYDDSYGITYEQLHADPDEAIPTIVERFKRVEQASDAVVIVGSDFTDVGNPAELGDNARIAANLGARVVLVVTGRDPHDLTARTPEQVARAVDSTVGELREAHTVLGGVVVNRGDEAQLDQIRSAVEATLVADSDVPVPVWVLPEEPLLAAPSVAQLLTALGGRLVAGDEALLGREVLGVTIAGMAMENVLDRLIEGGLLIVAADRTETLLAVLLAQEADTFPFLSGVIVNGPFEFSPVIERLIAGIGPSLPIVRTDGGTFETAQRILQTRGSLATGSRRKRDVALASFEGRVPAEAVFELVDAPAPTVVTPVMFEYGLLDRARADRKRIVLPEGDDDRILLAAGTLLDRRVADLTILGEESEVRARAAGLGVELGAAQVLSPHDPELVGRFAEEYARLRAHKGVSVEQAAERVQDVSYFGTMMVHLGLADGMVSGAAHTTAHTIRPSFEIVKTKPGTSIVSSVFLMSLADRVLVYGDCAVNPDPNAEQLADIAISSAATAAQFGVAPRIAMLSYSTGDSGSGADVDKVREATDLVRTRRPDLLVEGPIQYDAATDLAVASKKLPGSDVAGRATVFIFPDLNTGNNTYKAVQRSAGAVAIGPVLQGLNKPINDLSRGALVADIVNTVAITAIQAQGAPE